MQPIALLVAVVVPWLLLETWRSRRHERALRAAGAIEPADDVYAWMRIVYPGMFVAMTAEGALGAPACTTLVACGIAVFLAAKLLKWWAILSLGRLWSFHVLVLPGAPLVEGGPYRLMRHPNYVGLMGEIAGVALMMRRLSPASGRLSSSGAAGRAHPRRERLLGGEMTGPRPRRRLSSLFGGAAAGAGPGARRRGLAVLLLISIVVFGGFRLRYGDLRITAQASGVRWPLVLAGGVRRGWCPSVVAGTAVAGLIAARRR